MPKIDYKAAYERAQIERWLAPNAYMFVPPDFEKRYPPGKAPLWMTIAMERAPRRPQSTYRYVDGAEPINQLAPVSSAEKSQTLHSQVLRLPPSVYSGLKYSPDQPRVPAGQPGGGQWAGSGGPSDIPDPSAVGTRRDFNERIVLAADISGFTRHGINQAISRGVSPASILNAVNTPLQVLPQPNGTVRYIGHNAVVVLNGGGRVVTVWGR